MRRGRLRYLRGCGSHFQLVVVDGGGKKGSVTLCLRTGKELVFEASGSLVPLTESRERRDLRPIIFI